MGGYLSPGVYMEEVSLRNQPIEGVSTSTAGFIGFAERGKTTPQLVTSFEQYQRLYGGFTENSYLAYAVEGFFRNGGKRCYVARIPDNENDDSKTVNGITFKTIGKGNWRNRVLIFIAESRVRKDLVNMEVFYWPARLASKVNPETISVEELRKIAVSSGRVESYENLSFDESADNYIEKRINGISQLIELKIDTPSNGITPGRIYLGKTEIGQNYWNAARTITKTETEERVRFIAKNGGESGSRIGILIKQNDNDKLLFDIQVIQWPEGSNPTGDLKSDNPTINVGVKYGISENHPRLCVNKPNSENYVERYINEHSSLVKCEIIAKSNVLSPLTSFDGVKDNNMCLLLNEKLQIINVGDFTFTAETESMLGIYVSKTNETTKIYFIGWVAPPESIIKTIDGSVSRDGLLDQDFSFKFSVEIDDQVTLSDLQNKINGEIKEKNTKITVTLNTCGTPKLPEVTPDEPGKPLFHIGNPEAGVSKNVGEPTDASYLTRQITGGNDATPEHRTGLLAFKEIEDISIVLIPDLHKLNDDSRKVITQALINHCETEMKYRFAIIDGPSGIYNLSQAGQENVDPFRSKYAAFYYPWIKVHDPLTNNLKLIPPCGHVAGIYARTDQERGVHKAPANEVVRGAMGLEYYVTKEEQSVLNPLGINVIRSFPGRGILVWGARTTILFDPLWKYINVRRMFIYLQHSIERGSQWAVFEPNDERLWARLRGGISEFLTRVWREGGLMGTRAEEAFFVKCDRTTMTQDDIDNGRLIAVIGVAPVKPAEFVIFRIGQVANALDITEAES